jgi:hypothetical protein
MVPVIRSLKRKTMKLALLVVVLILSGCTRSGVTQDGCKPVPLEHNLCPAGYCLRDRREIPRLPDEAKPLPDANGEYYDCIPEKCNKGPCGKRIISID